MLNFGNKEFRNLQEQVEKNQQDIKTLKGGIKIDFWVAQATDLSVLMVEGNEGKYVVVGTTNPQHLYVLTKRSNDGWIADNLGEYPAVVEGPKGDSGDDGDQGERGNSIWGCTAELPSPTAYKEGDFYVLFNGNMYKKTSGVWVLQMNIKGPQGTVGPEGGTEVIANPETAFTAYLDKITIDGTTYKINTATAEQTNWLNKALQNLEWENDGSATFGHDVYADGDLQAGNDVEVGGNLVVDDLSKIQDQNGNEIINNALATIKSDAYKVVDTTVYPTLESFLQSTGEAGIQYLYPKTGTAYYKYIWEGSTWVSLGSTDTAVSIDAYTKAESNAKFVDFTSNQTISGTKSFTVLQLGENVNNKIYLDSSSLAIKSNSGAITMASNINPKENDSYSIGTSANRWKELYLNSHITIGNNYNKISNTANSLTFESNSGNVRCGAYFIPTATNYFTLGKSDVKWKDIYLSGNISDGTNSATIAQLVNSISQTQTQTEGGATSIGLKFWQGTQVSYDTITNKDSNTLYIIVG